MVIKGHNIIIAGSGGPDGSLETISELLEAYTPPQKNKTKTGRLQFQVGYFF